MTDKMLMAMLDSISKKEKNAKTYAEFMTVLLRGYAEGCGILGLYNNVDGNDMLLVGGDRDHISIMFFTKREYFYQLKRSAEYDMRSNIQCRFFSSREIINSLLDDKSIAAIIFNFNQNNYIQLDREFFEKYLEEGLFERLESNTH